MNKKIIIFIIGLIIIVLGFDFFIKSGTYFFLDTVFYPIYELKGFFSQSIYWHFRDILTRLLGYELYSKLFIVGVLITGSILGVYLSRLVNKILEIKNKKIILLNIFLSIVFIIFNPFSYERLVTQTGIALGVFLIGLGLVFLIDYIIFNKVKNSLLTEGFNPLKNLFNNKLYLSSLFFGLSLTIFPHSVVFLIIIFLLTLILYFKKFSIKNILYSIFIVFFINFNWLIGALFLGENKTIKSINTFDYKNIEVFTSNSLSNLGTEITNLLLYGFWGEKYHHLYTPEIINDKWYISGFIILIIIIFGIISLYKKEKKLTLYLLVMLIISYILSLGISSELFKNINLFFYNNIPYYIGMREPQKLTGLVMLIYSIFFIIGIYNIIKIIKKLKLKRYLNKFILNYYFGFALIFLVITAWSPNILFGFNYQIRITNFPKSFFQVKSKLLEENNLEKNLIFPWHSYIGCSWTKGKVISNISKNIFFPLEVISSDNIEIGGLYTNNKSLESESIEKFLKNKDFNLLKKLKIKNIIFLDKCADFKKYNFLEKNTNLEKIFNSDDIKIYKLK